MKHTIMKYTLVKYTIIIKVVLQNMCQKGWRLLAGRRQPFWQRRPTATRLHVLLYDLVYYSVIIIVCFIIVYLIIVYYIMAYCIMLYFIIVQSKGGGVSPHRSV